MIGHRGAISEICLELKSLIDRHGWGPFIDYRRVRSLLTARLTVEIDSRKRLIDLHALFSASKTSRHLKIESTHEKLKMVDHLMPTEDQFWHFLFFLCQEVMMAFVL
jgi:hypothetical protein